MSSYQSCQIGFTAVVPAPMQRGVADVANTQPGPYGFGFFDAATDAMVDGGYPDRDRCRDAMQAYTAITGRSAYLRRLTRHDI